MTAVKTSELTYEDGEISVRLVLSAPTVLTGMTRGVLFGRAQAYLDGLIQNNGSGDGDGENEAGKDTEAESGAQGDAAPVLVSPRMVAQRMVARYLFPDCIAAVVVWDGDVNVDDLTVETFMTLPQALTDAWQNRVYELCPDWNPFEVVTGDGAGETEQDTEAAETEAKKD